MMSVQKVFKRRELKYLITEKEKTALLKVMQNYMEPDKYGKSTINNIYLDTPDKLLVRKSLAKPEYKEKIRIRSYGKTNSESTVFIEVKKKYQGIVYKRRIALKEVEAMNYIYRGTLPSNQNQIFKEIDYLLHFYKDIEPSIFLSYNREAFYSRIDPNFRMTFDENILMRNSDLTLTSTPYGERSIPEGISILEVKTSMGLPKWLYTFLSKKKIYKTSFSKYGNAYMKLQLPAFLNENTLSKNQFIKRVVDKGGMEYANQ